MTVRNLFFLFCQCKKKINLLRMGHDIVIREFGKNGRKLERTGISFNFSSLSPSIHNLHGHPGRIIGPYLRRVLETLKTQGIEPNTELGVDGYGNYSRNSRLLNGNTEKREAWDDFRSNLPEVVHAINCMHAFHLSRFLTLAIKYPNGYWYSDQIWDTIELDGHLSDSSESENSES
jgi:hypothetical protein